VTVRVATPAGYEPPADLVARTDTQLTHDPTEAVDGADVVYTDVWASMGQEDEAARRRADFAGFTVDEELMARAKPHALFLHCLPAHRGEEVTAEVVDGPQSAVWLQAANRLHAQRGLLLWLFREDR
jgi:ornithine carbamoyltransferase